MKYTHLQPKKLDECQAGKSKETHTETIIIKLLKDKDRILKAIRKERLFMYMGSKVRLSLDFSAETLKAGRQWDDIFKMLK